MTRYYLYIEAGATIDETARWFKVAIGESAQERRVYSSLQFYAAGHGHYFQRWSNQVDELLVRLLQAYPDNLPLQAIKGSSLLRSFKESTRLPLAQHALRNYHEFYKKSNVLYLLSCRKVAHNLPKRSDVKNLKSHDEGTI